jgi:hypothetical protein
VDEDRTRYTVEVLQEHRLRAEQVARDRFGIRAEHGPELAQAEKAASARSAVILRQWQTYHFNQERLVELDFSERSNDGPPTNRTLWDAVQTLIDGRIVVLLGPPGAGKTMTLLQIAERLLGTVGAPIPFVLGANDWAASRLGLAEYVVEHLTGADLQPAAVRLLLQSGRLALLVNGWNESAEVEQAGANARIRTFLLNHPGTAIAITSRHGQSRPALPSATILDVRPLSRAKKASIVSVAGLVDPDRFRMSLESNPVLAELTDTPLFLAAAIKIAKAGREIPPTRFGLLQDFIVELEGRDNYSDMLRGSPCHGFHRTYLRALASAMTRESRTALSAPEAFAEIGRCSQDLQGRGLVTHEPAASIADSLVRHHALVSPPGAEVKYGFVHQQFQEWFAAQGIVETLQRIGAAAVGADLSTLRRDILNRPQWREPLAFAVEDLASAGSVELAAQIIRWMVPIDLISAAELCRVGGDAIWALVRAEQNKVLRDLYALDDGTRRESAVLAMLATGAADFEDLLWREIENDQNLRRICRHTPFRLRSLGPGWQQRIAALPERQQEILLQMLSDTTDREEIEFIESRAANADEPVRIAALELLLDRGANARVVEIITGTSFGNWSELIYERVIRRLPPEWLRTWIARLSEQLTTTVVPGLRCSIICTLQQVDAPAWVEAAQREIELVARSLPEEPNENIQSFDPPPLPEPARLIARYAALLHPVVPDWLALWLADKLGTKLLWKEPFLKYVTSFPDPLLVSLARMILVDTTISPRAGAGIRALIASQSASVVKVVLDAFLAEPRIPSRTSRDHLRRMLHDADKSALVDAVLAKGASSTDVGDLKAMIDLIRPEGFTDTTLTSTVQGRRCDDLRDLVRRTATLIPENERAAAFPSLALLLGALGHPDDVPLIGEWIGTELARWEARDQAVRAATTVQERLRAQRSIGANWWSWYRHSLALFQCSQAERVLRDWLGSPYLVAEGAAGLVAFSVLEGSLSALPFKGGPRPRSFVKVTAVPTDARVNDRADAIATALDGLARMPAIDSAFPRRLDETAEALATLNDRRALDWLLRPRPAFDGWLLIRALTAMVARGSVLPGRAVAETLEPFLAESEAVHRNGGNDPWYGVVDVLAILLASDAPGIAVTRMRRVPVDRLRSFHGRDLLELSSASDSPDAAAYLVEVSRTIDENLSTYPDLLRALGESRSPSCHARLLEMVTSNPPVDRTNTTWGALQDAGGRLAAIDEQFLTDVLAHISGANGEVRDLLVRVVGMTASENAALVLLGLPDPLKFESILRRLVSEASEAKEALGEGGAYYRLPRSITKVRQRLAGLLLSPSPNQPLAARLLAELRLKRAEYGQPVDEPLHPDIEELARFNRPWPLQC